MAVDMFVWYELMTSDVDAALAFYGKVLGWTSADFPGSPERYVIVSPANGKGIGGVMALPEGVPQPAWIGYVGVKDIDATLRGFTEAGGVIHRGPWEIPTVGRIAVAGDPFGAVIAVSSVQGASDGPSEAVDTAGQGRGSWHELHTPDIEAGLAFYGAQFGWSKGTTHDMGPNGIYQIIAADGRDIGGAVKTQPGEPPSWLYYFGAASMAASAGTVQGAGGTVLMGPHEVPGGAWILICKDPQGAMFALVGGK